MRHSNGDPAFWMVVGLGGGLVIFFRGFRKYREYRVVEDTPVIPIRSISMGLVNVRGTATGQDQLVSPVTRTPCYLYQVIIEKWHQDGNDSGWKHYATDLGAVKFYLVDTSGKVLVDTQNAELDLQLACEREVRSGRNVSVAPQAGAVPDAELLSYISQAGASRFTSFAARGLRAVGPLHDAHNEQMRQQLLGALNTPLGSANFAAKLGALMAPAVQQKLAQQGPLADPQQERARQIMLNAFKHPAGSPEFMEQARLAQAQLPPGSPEAKQAADWMAHLEQSMTQPDTLFSPIEGRFRVKEHCIVAGRSYEIVGTCTENPSPTDEHDRNLMTKGANEPTYLISDRPGQKAESHLRNLSLLMVFGGAGLTILCLALLLARFHLL